MADLLAGPLLRRDDPSAGSRAPWLAAAVASVWALGASLALLGVSALAVWFAEGASAPLADPLRLGGQIWLVAHRVGLDLDAGRLSLAPMGLTLPAVLLLHRAGRWAGHAAAVRNLRQSMVVAGTAAGVYGLGAIVVATLAVTSGAAAVPLEAAAVCAGLAGVFVGAGALHGAGLVPALLRQVPHRLHPALVGGAAASALLLAGGSLLVAVSLVVHADRVTGLARTLDAGVLGGLLVTLIGAVLVPNAVVWAAAFALGPGFAVGVDTLVSPGGVRLGAVPAVPLLAALPVDVPRPVAMASLAIPLLAGVAGGWFVSRRAGAGPAHRLVLHGLGAGLVTGGFLGMAALLSGGSVGADRLSVVGPTAWQVSSTAALEIGLTSALVALLLRWHSRGLPHPFRLPDQPAEPDPGAEPRQGSDLASADAATVRRPIRVKDGRRTRFRRR